MKIFRVGLAIKTAFIVFMVVNANSSLAQSKNVKINSNLFVEELQLFCDRDTYLPNDKIQFYVNYTVKTDLPDAKLSRVVYVELITYAGEPLVKNKLGFKGDGAGGILEIPENIPSGYYYLKAYTRWMRNYGAETYEYIPVKIINFRLTESVSIPAKDYKPMFYIDTTKIPISKKGLAIDENDILRGSTVNVKILPTNNNPKLYCITVFPYNLFNEKSIGVRPINESNTFHMDFMPETRGVSLSGVLLAKNSDMPIANTMVNISVLDSINQSITTMSDSGGRFYFNLLDSYGENELLITAGYESDSIRILVDNDFCSKKTSLPFIPFNLNNNELNRYKKFINTGIVEKQYEQNVSADSIFNTDIIELNYQKPDFELLLSDYIDLPSLGDYFYELVPNVGIRKVDEKIAFQLFGDYSEFFVYKPLVLLDNVIIADVNKLLQVSPKKIERIEVLEKPYAIGNYIYGGVISIFSKKGDLGDIELPNSGVYLNYQMLSKNSSIGFNQEIIDNKPNIRNTIFWKAFTKNEIKQLNSISFNVGDIPGKYIIEVKKLLGNNKIVIDTALFIVK